MVKYLISTFVFILASFANAQSTLAQMNFSVRNGSKVFNVQKFSKKHLYILGFGIEWANFDPKIDSSGFNLFKTEGIKFISPEQPTDCYLSDPITISNPISGYINGIEAGSNAIQIALKGDNCASYVENLKTHHLIVEFKNVQPIEQGAPITPIFRLEILDLP